MGVSDGTTIPTSAKEGTWPRRGDRTARLTPGSCARDSDTQRLREFATRNRLAHAWIDLDNDPAATVLLDSAGVHPGDTPVVLLEGTGVLRNPSNAQLAHAAGITGEPVSGRAYDLMVIGAGPGGLAAAVYGASDGLTTAAVDAVAAGGQASTTSRIENYLGFPTGVSGAEFGERALLQAVRLGAQMFVPHRAAGLTRSGGGNLLLPGQQILARGQPRRR